MDVRNITFEIPNELFAENRVNACKGFISKGFKNGNLLLQGGDEIYIYSSDTTYPFRQESFFTYLFGVTDVPGCLGSVDIATQKSTLFIPKLPQDYEIWEGVIHPPEYFKKKYGFDECFFIGQIPDKISKSAPLYILDGVNTDSGRKAKSATFMGLEDGGYEVNKSELFNILVECRTTKSAKEMEVMKYVCKVGAEAQCQMMKNCKVRMRGFELESIFYAHCFKSGCRFHSFPAICSSGKLTGILHYVKNSSVFKSGDLVLCDMGCSYNGYKSDITRTFPVSGKFSTRQKEIYELVLAAQTEIISKLHAGVSWIAMQDLALEIITKGLVKYGLLRGDVNELIDAGVAYYFMPHGVGHLLGLDTHDVGGYTPHGKKRLKKNTHKYLRNIQPLKKGMVITVEPGIYFNEPLLARGIGMAKEAGKKWFCEETLKLYLEFGGIRIEDDCWIGAEGCEVLTAGVPKTVEGIEKLMKSER